MTEPVGRPKPDGAMVVALRCQVPDGVLAIGDEPPRLTWQVAGADPEQVQTAYEIQASSHPDFGDSISTGPIASARQVAVAGPGAPMRSREVRYLRVRIETSAGWTDWGPTSRVEAGLLDAADWVAAAITIPDDPGSDRQSPSPVVRRSFELPPGILSARLYVTALGLHRTTINGRPVSEDVLAPGWTTYRHRLLADAYDVTSLLRDGENVIGAVLGDGWYRGRLGWNREGDRCRYGTDLGLIAQLEVTLADGSSFRVSTDGSWLASTAEVRSADLYDGVSIDLREAHPGWDRPGFDARAWRPATLVPFDPDRIEQRLAPPVRQIEVLPVVRRSGPAASVILDAGQNVAGYVRLRVQGRRGDRVTVRHAEVLEADGSLHTRSLRTAKATDVYILADDLEQVLEPPFTFHGFRYAQVETTAEIVHASVVALSSDLKRRGRFECSFEPLNRLHENVVWSQRDNFVSVPTDCPQRDERFGWTGDAQAFATTASTLFDAEAFWTSWLRDLALDQDDHAGVSSVVPDVVLEGEPRFGRAGWADAATIVPWAVLESYGDDHVLRQQFDSMRRWMESLRAREGSDGLLGPAMQFGDWLDPDAPPDRPWQAKTDSTYLANAFYANSARLTADAAALLDEPVVEADLRSLADRVAAGTWARWRDHALTTPTGCAIGLQFFIAPESERSAVGDALAGLVRASDGRVATGFLGTPLVLPALAATGHFDEAYLMLLCREVPSWLYQVDQGATTVWERWDAIRPDGSIHPGSMSSVDGSQSGDGDPHMLSFNHYAYGAVIDWVYRHVAGIGPDRGQPGYRHVVLSPQPASQITRARASIDTPYGDASIDWQIDTAGDLVVDVELPFGTTGTFVPPTTARSRVSIDGASGDVSLHLLPGPHRLVVTNPRIAGAATDADVA